MMHGQLTPLVKHQREAVRPAPGTGLGGAKLLLKTGTDR
jgi:hypothetical protein